MYDRILKQIQEKVRTRQYVMTLHAEEEMNDDELTSSMSNAAYSQARSLSGRKTRKRANGSIWSRVKRLKMIQ